MRTTCITSSNHSAEIYKTEQTILIWTQFNGKMESKMTRGSLKWSDPENIPQAVLLPSKASNEGFWETIKGTSQRPRWQCGKYKLWSLASGFCSCYAHPTVAINAGSDTGSFQSGQMAACFPSRLQGEWCQIELQVTKVLWFHFCQDYSRPACLVEEWASYVWHNHLKERERCINPSPHTQREIYSLSNTIWVSFTVNTVAMTFLTKTHLPFNPNI